mmetsp:Transcript_24911/g.24583  ORF Transcript_24911/g.24583 Transcript_24911/m.24583 type:complete len:341 (+) Transcript_24911:178-1200(+)
MRQQYLNGVEMAYRYISQSQTISPTYTAAEIYVRSTDTNRTIMSAQTQLFGIYPTGPQIISQTLQQSAVPPFKVKNQQQYITALGTNALPNGFQPIPIHVVSANYDNMLVGYTVAACPRFAEILMQQQESEEYQRKVSIYSRGLQNQIYQVFNLNVTYEIAGYMCDTLTADKYHGFSLPDGVTDDLYYEMYANQNYTNSYFFTQEGARLAGSQFFQAVINQFDGTINGTSSQKFGFYSAHDTTLIGFLKFLGVWDGNNPVYASSLIFELHNNAGNYAVHISYNGNSILLDGCTDPCAYGTFKAMIEDKIIPNVTEACQLQDNGRTLRYSYNPYLDIEALT